MCGIAGIFTQRPVDEAALREMASTLAHRGPDDAGTWADPEAGIGFGHRRLSILDLSPAGHQPMADASGRYIICYNGEIYNHFDLRRELDAATGGSIQWRGHSDTEILLAAIAQWGLAATLARSAGMFAIALWDRFERKLTLVRDRIGEKPLYYGWYAGGFAFGSELKAFRQLSGFDNPISRLALDYLIRRAYVPGPLSIYERIFKLEPGCLLTLNATHRQSPPEAFGGFPFASSDFELSRYWDYRSVAAAGREAPIESEEEALLGLESQLVRTVGEQSVADVPVGTFLSGGIDSSLIAAVQQNHTSSKVETFTIGFDEPGFNEAEHAKAVAAHLGTAHHELYVSPDDALQLIPELPTIYDEPFADSSQVPTTMLSRMARRRVTVALSGDGGDEVFGGYRRYVGISKHHQTIRRTPAPVRRLLAGIIDAVGPRQFDRMGALLPERRRIPQLGIKSQKLSNILSGGDDLTSLYSTLIAQWEVSSPVVRSVDQAGAWPAQEMVAGLDSAEQMMVWDATSYLPDDILCKVDRAAMSTSLETRAPYLDHRVIEYAARIPMRMKIAPDGGKWILRQLLYRYVPRTLIDRPKTGFSIPLGRWLRGPLREWAEELIDPARLEREGFFNVTLLRERWRTHLSGARDYSSALWPILMFQAWLEVSVESSALSAQDVLRRRTA